MTDAADERAEQVTARRFAWKWLRAELRCVLSRRHFRRPSTFLIVGTAVIITVVAAPTLRLVLGPTAAAFLLALLIGVALAIALYSAAAWWVERRNFAAAPHRWLLPLKDGWGGAYAQPDRRGRMTLYSVWASPPGQHLADGLMRRVCTEMDNHGGDLHLVVVNREVVRFYRQFGFQPVPSPRFAQRMVRTGGTSNAGVD